MSLGHHLNEAEINEFLAHADSDDDSDWDNMEEVEAEKVLRPPVDAAKTEVKKAAAPVKTAAKKNVVSYRQIKDIGVDILFAAPPKRSGLTTSRRVEEEEEEEVGLNPTGSFVQERLREGERKRDEERVEKEIRRQESWSRSATSSSATASQSEEKPINSANSVAVAKIADGSRKDFFIPSGTCVRVVKPRISAQSWEDRIFGRKVCKLSSLRPKMMEELVDTEWLTVGVVAYPPDVRRSKSGSGPAYSIWRLTDLDDLDRMVSLFIFGSAHNQLWKEASVGLVVALLRPKQSDNVKADEVTLTMDKAQQALIVGQSKDFATCNSRTKAGAMCQRIVNRSLCEYCEFHVRQLYRNAGNQRSGFSQAIGAHAKRLAAGLDGKSRSRAPPRRSLSLPAASPVSQMRVLERLGGPGASQLMGHMRASAGLPSVSTPVEKTAGSVGQRGKMEGKNVTVGGERKETMGGGKKEEEAKAPVVKTFGSFFKAMKEQKASGLDRIPRLSDPAQDLVRARAAAKVRASGGVAQMQAEEKRRQVLRRLNEGSTVPENNRLLKRKSAAPDIFPVGIRSQEPAPAEAKKRRILKAMNVASEEELMREIGRGSRHTQLVESETAAAEERHFKALEFREKYEDKLAAVKEHKVKTVACAVCRYRAEGSTPSPVCAKEHPQALRFGHGVRRYFKCGECGERTTSLEKIPTHDCKKCGSSNLVRTGMLRERKGPKLANETLLVRGEEHGKFLNSTL